MAAINPPYRLDPLQTIVSIHWPTKGKPGKLPQPQCPPWQWTVSGPGAGINGGAYIGVTCDYPNFTPNDLSFFDPYNNNPCCFYTTVDGGTTFCYADACIDVPLDHCLEFCATSSAAQQFQGWITWCPHANMYWLKVCVGTKILMGDAWLPQAGCGPPVPIYCASFAGGGGTAEAPPPIPAGARYFGGPLGPAQLGSSS